uniref:NADH:ubiquinone reductase (H(+)-translocating) n=1 Tax=Tanaisia sp. SS-2020 TaxID=2780549 RepID=A0A894JTH0_9TREM|nr:NADH dehydrogenase subunit 5 [Tanaisia sp. SS-2020]
MFLVSLGLLLVVLGMFRSPGCYSWCLSGRMWGYPLSDFSFSFVFDDLACAFVLMLGCCVVVAVYYGWHYAGNGLLSPLMVGFGGSMLGLVLSGNFVTSLVFWEYLGLFSFLLILFYSNVVSLRAAVITLFASRFGDVSLFLLLSYCSALSDVSSWGVVLCVFLVVSTKSAVYPFISWLLEAMRAPTPVSSLVHSSTLVTAGVWFLFRYGDWFSCDALLLLSVFCFVSIFVSGVCALVCDDLKKVVALSTCNNISWCIVFSVLSSPELALVQLLVHGISKCYLFMSVGDLICSGFGSQGLFGSRSFGYLGPWEAIVSAVLVFSLCGLPFMGVFYSKHAFFYGSSFFVFNLVMGLSVFVGLVLSYAYSFRLFTLLVITRSSGIPLDQFSGFFLSTVFSLVGSMLGSVSTSLVYEEWEVGAWVSCVLFVGSFVGSLLGCWVTGGGCVSRSTSVGCVSSFGADVFVMCVYRWFVGVSRLCSWVSHRWEEYAFGGVRGSLLEVLVYSFYGVLFSLGVFVLLCLLFFGVVYLFG